MKVSIVKKDNFELFKAVRILLNKLSTEGM